MAAVTAAPVTRNDDPSGPAPTEVEDAKRGSARPVRVLVGIVGMAVIAWFICNAFLAFAYFPGWFAHSGILIGILGLVVGIGGAVVFFYFLNICIEGFPAR